ncbi:MAG: cation transporter [Anaerolineales bacterium]
MKRLAELAGAQIVNRYHHESIPIENMDCSDCSLVIEHSVGRMEGVLSVNVNYPTEKMWIEYDNHKINRAAIEKRVRSLGYQIPLNEFQARLQENRELLFSLLSGLFLLIGWLGGTFFSFPSFLSIGLFAVAYILGGWDVSRHGGTFGRKSTFDTDGLMVVAAIGAAFLGEFAEGALLLFLFSLGHALEERALDRARSAVRALADLALKTALVNGDGKEQELPVEFLQLDDVVIVRPGVRIPVDGIILDGNSGYRSIFA